MYLFNDPRIHLNITYIPVSSLRKRWIRHRDRLRCRQDRRSSAGTSHRRCGRNEADREEESEGGGFEKGHFRWCWIKYVS